MLNWSKVARQAPVTVDFTGREDLRIRPLADFPALRAAMSGTMVADAPVATIAPVTDAGLPTRSKAKAKFAAKHAARAAAPAKPVAEIGSKRAIGKQGRRFDRRALLESESAH